MERDVELEVVVAAGSDQGSSTGAPTAQPEEAGEGEGVDDAAPCMHVALAMPAPVAGSVGGSDNAIAGAMEAAGASSPAGVVAAQASPAAAKSGSTPARMHAVATASATASGPASATRAQHILAGVAASTAVAFTQAAGASSAGMMSTPSSAVRLSSALPSSGISLATRPAEEYDYSDDHEGSGDGTGTGSAGLTANGDLDGDGDNVMIGMGMGTRASGASTAASFAGRLDGSLGPAQWRIFPSSSSSSSSRTPATAGRAEGRRRSLTSSLPASTGPMALAVNQRKAVTERKAVPGSRVAAPAAAGIVRGAPATLPHVMRTAGARVSVDGLQFRFSPGQASTGTGSGGTGVPVRRTQRRTAALHDIPARFDGTDADADADGGADSYLAQDAGLSPSAASASASSPAALAPASASTEGASSSVAAQAAAHFTSSVMATGGDMDGEGGAHAGPAVDASTGDVENAPHDDALMGVSSSATKALAQAGCHTASADAAFASSLPQTGLPVPSSLSLCAAYPAANAAPRMMVLDEE